MKAMNQFNSMIKSMPLWLQLVLGVLFVVWLIFLLYAFCSVRENGDDTQVMIKYYQSTDSIFVARLECTRDSIQMLNKEILEVRDKIASLQEELNKIRNTQQISSVINNTQPMLKPKTE